MNTFIIIILTIITISIVVLVYYVVTTCIQIQKTAKQLEEVLSRIKVQLDNVGKISSLVSTITSTISPFFLSAISFLGGGIGIVKNIFNRRKKQ